MSTPQAAGFTPDPNDPIPALDPDANDQATDPGRETEPDEPSSGPESHDVLDPGEPAEPVGNDNIREGRVGGVMGGPRQQQGQGQGG
jgi:hypothetical protein